MMRGFHDVPKIPADQLRRLPVETLALLLCQGMTPAEILEGMALGIQVENLYVQIRLNNFATRDIVLPGEGPTDKGVFCLEHRKVMSDGICPKCPPVPEAVMAQVRRLSDEDYSKFRDLMFTEKGICSECFARGCRPSSHNDE